MCQGYGHIALDCVNHTVVIVVNGELNNIFEEEIEDIQESFQEEMMGEPIFDEEYLPAEYGETLEVERSLQTTITKDMVCNVIIDNKSCENVESNYMLEKLKMPTKEHLHPYKLQRLNKDDEVKVSQHSIFSFSIDNNYKENLWCDVIPMDTFHIHLERPWKYDRRALYSGYANTYSFVKDVIKIKLAHLLLNDFNEGKEQFKPLKLLVPKEPFKENTKLYMPRPIPKPPWKVISMDFSLGLLWSQQQKDSIKDSYQKINDVF